MTLDEMNLTTEVTSMHQSIEWGMQAFQASFPRVKDRIEFESIGRQKLMMKVMILLLNLRVRQVGKNQILNIYMPSLNVDVNQMYG